MNLDSVYGGLLAPVSGQYRLVGWRQEKRETSVRIARQAANVCQSLGEALGRTLWDTKTGGPYLKSEDEVRYPPLRHVVISVSPRPRLRVWLFGLSMGLSMTAARRAIASSPAYVVGQSSLADGADIAGLASNLQTPQTDVVVICGGYESAAPSAYMPVLELCKLVRQALERVPPSQRPDILYAGNQQAAAAARHILQAAGDQVEVDDVANVMPGPNEIHQTALARVLGYRYWRLSRRTPGFSQLERWVTSPVHIMIQESNFIQLTHLWRMRHKLPHLHGVYNTPEWQLHVLTHAGLDEAQICYVDAGAQAVDLQMWPPVQLASGPWPNGWSTPDAAYWWDSEGIAPAIAAVGQVSPQAMLQVLNSDVFEYRV